MKRNFRHIFVLLSLVMCLTYSSFGQNVSGDIQGTVQDATGAVVPNATLTIRGVDVGFTRNITTDDEGFYRAIQVPPGNYRVTVGAIQGFVEQTSNIQVNIGNVSTLNFTLSTNVQTVVDVNANPDAVAIDSTETKVQENFSEREIELLPKGTTFTSVLRTGVSTRNEPLSGQFQINGGSGAENSFIVDGQEVSNFRTGALNSANDIPFQAVQEVQVKSSGFEAEFGGATGGVVNTVTKGGTNDFRGEFGVQFSPQKLNARPRDIIVNTPTGAAAAGANLQFVDVFRQERDRGTNFFPTGSLGGRIIKDKLWFFGIWSPQVFNTTRTTNFVTGFGPDRTPIGPGSFASTLPDVVRNSSATQTTTAKQTNEYGFIRIDANPTDKLRVTSSFTYNPVVQDGVLLGSTTFIGTPGFGTFGGNTLAGSDLAAVQGGRQNSNNFRVEGVYTPTSDLVVRLQYSRGFLNEKLNSYFIPDAPRIRCRSFTSIPTTNPNFPGGLNTAQLIARAQCNTGFQTNSNNFAVEKDVSIRNTIDADLTYITNLAGRHEFKGGYQFNRISNDVNQGYGNQGQFNLCYGITNINTSCAGNAPPVGLNNALAPADTIGIGWSRRFQTVGSASNRNQAIYLQDKYQPFNRLTFNLGARIEREDLPAFNGQTTNLKFDFFEKFAPRVGVAYALTGDGKTKISAFFGRFYDRLKFELPRGSFGGDFFRDDFFYITNSNAAYFNYTIPTVIVGFNDAIGGACPVANTGIRTRCNVDYRVPSNLPNLVLSSGAPLQPGAVDPDLKPFRQSEFTVEFQREIIRSSVFTGRYLYRNVDDAVEDAGFLTSTNSEFYIIANPGKGLYAQRARELGFQRIAEPQRRYDALQLELDSRFVRNINFNVNYTFSRLYGNYSGLASSDENGRLSPGVNRFFDQPFVGFTASGQPDNGRLATDRPHVFKATGTYSFDYFGSNTNRSDITFFTTVQSGTPLTTFVDVYNIFIPKTRRGDLGRTEKFTQTDMSFTHRYNFGRDNKYALAFDFNVLNLFNEANVLNVDFNESSAFYALQFTEVAPTYVQAVNLLTSGGILSQLNASQGEFPENINESYKRPNTFQGPRNVRFGFRFIF